MLIIDPIKPARQPRPSSRRSQAQTASAPRRQPPGPRFTKIKGVRKRRWPLRVLWALLIVLGAVPVMFVLAGLGALGQAVVGVYAVVALAARLPSRITFLLALVAFVTMMILQTSVSEQAARSIATLAYELLAVGVVLFAFEARRDARLWFRKK